MDQTLINLLQEGFNAQQQGDFECAEQCYAQVLELDGANEFALNLLGVLCVRSGRATEAVEFLKRACSVNRNDPDTHNNLGLAYAELHKFTAARASFERSLQLAPNQAETLNNLGNALAAVDLHKEAVVRFESALQLNPEFVECVCNLAESYKALGLIDQALSAAEHAVSKQPTSSRAHNIHGEVLLQAAQHELANEAFLRAINIDNSIAATINLSTTQKQLGDGHEAAATLRGVLAREPENSEGHNHLGVLCEQLGDTEAAAGHFRRALAITPGHASSYYQLAKLKDHRLSDSELAKVHELVADSQTLDIFRSSLLFALACESEKVHDYDAGMAYFIRAQALKAARYPYDAVASEQYMASARQSFPLPALTYNRRQPVPVFVVGMPRSGTTLTEQIIASHSRIAGAGELGFMSDLVRQAGRLTGKRFPECIAALTAEERERLRIGYLDRLVNRAGISDFIVDKNPLNFNQIGTIATLFPDARIIYCKRDAMDNCVSIFKLPFDDNQGYSHDLNALGHYYRQHEKLMAYWKSCYPDQILTVQYEDTVGDLKKQAQRMLAFVGVEFEEAVLRFYDNRRLVLTPSASQVREPIYHDSIATWKRYQTHLGPLIAGLAGDTDE